MPSHALKPWKITLLRAQAPTELSNSGWRYPGFSTTQTLAWGTTVTLGHNYYFSSSPYPRSNPGQGSDGDPEGDGSDVYVVQATVLETGARSGYGVIEHLGPFPPPPPRANGVDGG